MKKQKQTIEPHFTLPGSEARVQAAAYAQGVHCVPGMFFMARAEGELLSTKDGFLLMIPKDENIPEMVGEIADTLINDPQKNTTNNPALFRELYADTFLQGYRFGLFSLHHGILDMLAELPDEKHYEVIFRFAWEKFVKESVYEPGEKPDILMDDSVETVKAIYKQYQSLN